MVKKGEFEFWRGIQKIVVKANVMDANTMEFIHMNVHPWFIINLYLTFNLISIHS